MARNRNTFAKRQKEIARKRKAAEKRERRWAKKERKRNPEAEEIVASDDVAFEEEAQASGAPTASSSQTDRLTTGPAAGEENTAEG